ncbi:protein RST1 isoform X1 [Cucurbita maxima]|uniref:Protein RST1 isoform X1 n=2 Tax=Cucurbita maxima TaxID=3661 RepID=A0A6J1JLD4_CUCMA|nr:protein RST1 isoform X1 [Cucurbita maxima]
MDSYAPLLEKLRLPQPSLQRFAVTSIFSKLRAAPQHLNSDSGPGREAISQCLLHSSPAVVDQSVRELCRLVKESYIDVSRALMELQAALEGSESRFVNVFVKGLGFLVQFGFQKHNGSWQFGSAETHPFVKVLSCRVDVQAQLLHQILLFMVQNKSLGMEAVCEFLSPFVKHSILRTQLSDSSSSLFMRNLMSSIMSVCCSLPQEALPIFDLLIQSLKYVPRKTLEDFWNFIHLVESLVDACTVVLRLLVTSGSHLIMEAQQRSLELLDTIFSLYACLDRHVCGFERIIELSTYLLSVQKDLKMQYVSKLSSAFPSLFTILLKSELEHEQLLILKLLLSLLQWKAEHEYANRVTTLLPSEELLFVFPAISLMSSPSKCIKGAATELLSILEKLLVTLLVTTKDEVEKERAFHFSLISTPGSIIVKLLEKLWFQGLSSQSSGFFLDFALYGQSNSKDDNDLPKMCWTSKLREYSLWIVDRRKSLLPLTQFEELFVREMPFLVSAITSIMVVHHSLASDAVELLAALGTLDPKIGFQLFLLFLFYCNIFSRKEVDHQDMVLKLLALLPCLASHSAMVPFIVEAISPMLRKDSNPVLYATATRLLCQSWEKNDRVFGSLQRVLLPNGFSDFVHEREICLSLAASIRDVCRKDADRGVDLILSVSACIESPDPINQALGFQGLAHLCEADVIDFYTAWDVIAEYPLDYSANPVLANSLCNLLRWGAIDAEVYPEASKDIIGILFTVGTSTCPCHDLQWTKAKASAFDALSQYEVSLLERSIVDFKERSTSVLFTEIDVNILSAIKGLLVKIISHEHSNRRRLVKEKRVAGSKIEKLLDVYPRLVFSSGNSTVRELPAAALLCLSFSSRKGNDPERRTKDEHASYVDAMCEIAESLQLSRNIVMALLALESWKAFMERWLKSEVFSFDVRDTAVISEKTCKAANAILKSIIHAAEEALPRSAENMALAIGALCMVLPQAAHAVKSTAAKYLLNWLFQHEHEHRQWPSAISLGIISRCLHVTDHTLKFQNISGLLEVLSVSKSTLVKGACGVGLGYSSHNLLSGVEIVDKSNLVKDKQTSRIEDVELLGTIVRALSLMICQLTGSSTDMLEDLFTLFPVHSFDISVDAHLLHENGDFEDVWGVAGLILGLGNTIVAMYKAGTYNAVLEIKRLISSWMPHGNSVLQYSDSFDDNSVRILSVGSCLALPAVMTFCHRFELMNGDELGHLINVYKETISELLSVKKSTTSHQNLLMASCIGAGNLLAGILNEGVCSIEVGCVQDLLELFRRCYSNPYSPLIHFGGMLGVVNAMGVGVGSLFDVHPTTSSVQIEHDLKESSHLMGPLLSSRVCEPLLTSVMQEMYLVAQNSDDKKLQQYAAWAVSFLRHNIWSKKSPNIQNLNETDESGSRSIPQNFQVDGVVMRLCNWLKQLNLSGTGPATYIDTLVTILRCLSQAPRLPSLDWGVIIRRCMRYEDQVAESQPQSSALRKGILREECLKFSLAHANQFDQLLIFLDELSDISRFRTLALNLQSCLLIHLAGLMNVFSNSRVEKLFNDMKNYLFSSYSNKLQYNYEKHLLCISCWKGLYQCLEEASLNSLECISHIENFMEVLFIMLPTSPSITDTEVDEVHSTKEWSEAIRCLGKARQAWLLDFLQVSSEDLVLKDEKFFEVLKKMKAKAKLTRNGSLPLSELGKLKILMLNLKLQDVWDVLVEVVAALQLAEGNVKRQWLVDTVEISCVSVHPSTALHFLGLLSGSFSKYMPLLILEPHAVLKDLPVTLNSLISTSGWGYIAEPIASHLLASTERILNTNSIHSSQPIDESETDTAISLLHVMHNTCVSLKEFLPLEEQLRVANMNIITQQRG